MRWFLRITLVAAMLLGIAMPAVAQDDRGYLQALLEDNLSDAGREVRIEGFEGALSRRATIEALTIADADGTWLRLQGLVLDWDRAALLQGAIMVNTLSAEVIHLQRLPATQPGLPKAEAVPLVLPELPVSIDIGSLRAKEIQLGEQVLGVPVKMQLDASAKLANGTGQFALDASRIDGMAGNFSASGGFSNTTRELQIALSAQEESNGIIARNLGLPDLPSLDFSLTGSGPLARFLAEFDLQTDGVSRVSGIARLEQNDPVSDQNVPTGPLNFDVSLAGDVRPLFPEDARAFFGSDLRAHLVGQSLPDGGVSVSDFFVSTQELTLKGLADIDADGWPRRVDVTGEIAGATANPVVLPIGASRISLDGAELALRYDGAASDVWRASLVAREIAAQDFVVRGASLTGQGRLRAAQPTLPDALSAKISLVGEGVKFADAALARAIGTSVELTADLRWGSGHPFALNNMMLRAGDAELEGIVEITGVDAALELDVAGSLALAAPDISRFAVLAGRELGGALNAEVTGRLRPISGAFDVDLSGTSRNLRFGVSPLDSLLAGDGRLRVSAARGAAGLTIEGLSLATSHVTMAASADLSSEVGQVTLDGQLAEIARIFPSDLSGPAQFDASIIRQSSGWLVGAQATGPEQSNISVSGNLATGFEKADLAIGGRIPLGALNNVISPNVLNGMAEADLRLNGPFAVSALEGRVTIAQATASLPALRLGLENAALRADLQNGQMELDMRARSATGGRVEIRGPVALAAPFGADLQGQIINLRLSDGGIFETIASGDWAILGPLADGPMIRADIELAQTEVTLADIGAGLPPVLDGVAHLGGTAAQARTRAHAGLNTEPQAASGGAVAIDIRLEAPSRLFVRGRGLDAELGGQVQLLGASDDVVSQGRFDLIRGRLDILGKRLVLNEGYAQLQGNLDPSVFLVATTVADGVDIRVTVSGLASEPDVRFSSSPQLPEDEILALFLFGRSITKISAVQAVQLAAAVRTLAGHDAGLLNDLRKNFGLDDLDITTSESGEVGARLGKYISENVYSDVTVGGGQPSEINLNLILTPKVTARGSVNEDGESALGVFFETDY